MLHLVRDLSNLVWHLVSVCFEFAFNPQSILETGLMYRYAGERGHKFAKYLFNFNVNVQLRSVLETVLMHCIGFPSKLENGQKHNVYAYFDVKMEKSPVKN